MRKYVLSLNIIFFLLILTSCSKQMISNKVLVPNTASEFSYNPMESFQEIKSKYTVFLRSEFSGGRPGMMLPMGGRGGGGSRGDMFPLIVKATLMHNQLIEAGLQYYGEIAMMSSEEMEDFKQNYRSVNELDNYILIEADVSTNLHKDYLDLSRYTIFIEDDQENQIVAAKIEEARHTITNRDKLFDESDSRRSFSMEFESHFKKIILYFPKVDYYGKPVMHETLEYLKLVFLLDEGGLARAEGSWLFQ